MLHALKQAMRALASKSFVCGGEGGWEFGMVCRIRCWGALASFDRVRLGRRLRAVKTESASECLFVLPILVHTHTNIED